jgi:hypothetical protein
MMRWGLIVLLVLVAGFAAFVRLAPSDPERWHVVPDVRGDETGAGEAKRLVPGGQDAFEALHEVIVQTPRTRVLAGDVASGHVTYVTRSALWGFPDYTTVRLGDAGIAIWGRLRFGGSDLGVNAARIDGWLAALRGG